MTETCKNKICIREMSETRERESKQSRVSILFIWKCQLLTRPKILRAKTIWFWVAHGFQRGIVHESLSLLHDRIEALILMNLITIQLKNETHQWIRLISEHSAQHVGMNTMCTKMRAKFNLFDRMLWCTLYFNPFNYL